MENSFFRGSLDPIVLHISSGPTTCPLQPGVSFESFQSLRQVTSVGWHWFPEKSMQGCFWKGSCRCLPLMSNSFFLTVLTLCHPLRSSLLEFAFHCLLDPWESSPVKGRWNEGFCLILPLEQITSHVARSSSVRWDVLWKPELQQWLDANRSRFL